MAISSSDIAYLCRILKLEGLSNDSIKLTLENLGLYIPLSTIYNYIYMKSYTKSGVPEGYEAYLGSRTCQSPESHTILTREQVSDLLFVRLDPISDLYSRGEKHFSSEFPSLKEYLRYEKRTNDCP